ncbi:MAG: NAD(P)/FAD-dependent oxidoreductase [Microscillaceae bacterium]|jgi:sulfide:quinone oxidoreductase|nr:NAD(P)/FAD-dependent oxidoreductase [Microscillaceae bacterium]
MAKIVVLGSNFAGLTAALETKRRLGKDHEVVVISPAKKFLFVPSLIWVPFGRRKVEDITFELAPILEKRKVDFLNDKAIKVLPDENLVRTENSGDIRYDYLVVATGSSMDFNVVPHLNPEEGYVNCIVTPPLAQKAYDAFEDLVKNPGPVVVGATQGASCMGAAYEYLFNMDRELRRRKIRDKVELTWITPEPFLGHFGIGGINGGKMMVETFMKMYNIKWITEASIETIEKDKIILKNGSELPYKMTMLIPPFIGQDVMRNSPELVDEKGFVVCNEGYQHIKYPNVYAAGLAVEVLAPFKNCTVPFGVPKTGYPSDVMGKVVAKNITYAITGKGKFTTEAFGKIPGMCIMDAGNKEVLIFANHLFKPRQFEIMIPNLLGDFGKVMLEKYMLMKNKRGLTYLP